MRSMLAMLGVAWLTACTMMPHYRRPDLPVSPSWPQDAQPPTQSGPQPVPAAEIGWNEFFIDPRLRRLIEIALRDNRNLRIAVLNVAASEAQYRIQRGALLPSISASGSGIVEKIPSNGATPLEGTGTGGGAATSVQPTGSPGSIFRYYTAGVGITNYELDLFGRERSLTTQAFEQYLSTAENRRSTQISLVAEVASDYFSLLADQALLKLTQETLQSQSESYDLTKAMFDRDSATLLSLRQAETSVDAARASLAQYQRQVAQDLHALTLVLGEDLPADLPAGQDIDGEALLADLPAGLPSDLLARRPDVVAAEHALRAANANIGAARAAFFPSIQLTGSAGSASSKLGSLFDKGTGTWLFAPTITLPIFAGGSNVANLDLANIEKNINVAQYEMTIQTAFREVSDALTARSSYHDQLEAQDALVRAEADAYRLAQMRFRAGVDSYLTTLDAQRSLYAAQQTLLSLKQAQLDNLVTLYKTLGGGWTEATLSR
jgi:multidrug efflux system outer membrane protein